MIVHTHAGRQRQRLEIRHSSSTNSAYWLADVLGAGSPGQVHRIAKFVVTPFTANREN
ncbi:hypothetical protein ACNKHV_13705 [Shigella flexneri]